MKKQQKQVIILTRYSWRKLPRVCYRVRSGSPLRGEPGVGQDVIAIGDTRYLVYQVLLQDGIAKSCSCGSRSGSCYHRERLVELEAQRSEKAALNVSRAFSVMR